MSTLGRLFGYLRPYAGRMVLAAALLAISGALMAVVVSTVKPLVNEVLLPQVGAAQRDAGEPASGVDILSGLRDALPFDAVANWARDNAFVQVPLLIVLIFFIRSVVLYFGQYITIRSGAYVIRDLRVELYESVVFQSQEFFLLHPTGLILSRILNDVARLQRVSTSVLADLVRVGAMVPFVILTAFLHEWRMSLLAIVALPLLGYPMVRLGKRLRRASTASQENMATVAGRLTESVSGIKVVQGFGMEQFEVRRFRDSVERMLSADLRAGRAQALSPAVMELVAAAVGGALFYTAGRFIAAESLDPGNFAVVLFCLGLLFMSTRRLNALYSEIQNALAAADRVFEMLDRKRAIADSPASEPLPPFKEQIEFSHVNFDYGDDPVLRDVDLTLKRGETIALVGPSGSGKSTIANLLSRFYDVSEGAVLIDGQDLREVKLASLRDQIGLVSQETVLFDDTVRNNIAYGRGDIPLEDVMVAAKAGQAHKFIEAMPDGYDTVVGERGARLSMGQRQRITIARALLKDPPILILDEATSALDAESEAAVQEALERLMRGRTSLVIAHRLATVRRADRIIVLDAGSIIEEGTHEELLRRDGAYARLCALQFREGSA